MCAALGVGAAAPAPTPTFTRDVAPILYKNCAGCHRPGEIAPMSLLTYEQVRPWAKSIAARVSTGTMPPWHSVDARGTFSNDRRLSDADRDTLIRWAGEGAPQGDPKAMPPMPKFSEGWEIGTPDVVLSMATPFDVPATGTIGYQFFTVPTNFTEDKWIQAIEVRPGVRSVVHHILVFAQEPGAARQQPAFTQTVPSRSGLQGVAGGRANGAAANGEIARRLQALADDPAAREQVARLLQGVADARANGAADGQRAGLLQGLGTGPQTLIATTAPGTNAMMFEAGQAIRIRAGATLAFQIHYTANGKTASDQSSVGVIFAKEPPKTEIKIASFTNPTLLLPAGSENTEVPSAIQFTEDSHITALFPHTHLRGKSWEYRMVYPDGRSEVVLSVPKYDFNWQTYYEFARPLAAPKGSRLEATARYDNSASNKWNPDPTKDVRWGQQTWDEMQYTGINYFVDKPASAQPARANDK
jgi:hypothetical protein